jgi:hypothetical protein
MGNWEKWRKTQVSGHLVKEKKEKYLRLNSANAPSKLEFIEPNPPDPAPENQSRIVGSTVGRIRRLGGYQKYHHVPDGHSEAARNFVRKAGQPDVKAAADSLYADVRSLFGYKRKEFSYTCEDGFAWIKTPDFEVQLRADQCPAEPKNYRLSTEIVALHTEAIAQDERFHACFTHHCDQLVIEFAEPVRVEDKIDRIEDIPELIDALSYEPDGSAFALKLPELDLQIHVTESTMTFQLLTLRNLGKLLNHSQKAFDLLADCDFGLRLRQAGS